MTVLRQYQLRYLTCLDLGRAAGNRAGMVFLTIQKQFISTGLYLLGLVSFSAPLFAASPVPLPTFSNVTVHDPSVVRAGSEFYVFGSHLASAYTSDWLHWTQFSSGVTAGNPLAPQPTAEFQEVLAWANSDTLWAPDVIQLADGRYYMYYCSSQSDAPRAGLGLAVSDSIRGPYHNLGLMLKSGMWGEISPAGTIYDPTVHPNTVDPNVFFDKTGNYWMVYGSYSGGIFILKMDPASGLPGPGQGYGKKLIGGNHSAIEAPYILYSPESDYYYLFLSFGGLSANGGYNIRMGRSRNPDGPFLDPAGTDLSTVSGPPGRFFYNPAIEPHGVKLFGNYRFLHLEGEPTTISRGYVSPGHNSAYYDPTTGKHFLVFHTRFEGRGEEHEVRVHQLFMNADEWLVAAPHRYAGESLAAFADGQIPGTYKLINHGKAISAAINTSVIVTLNPDHTITGVALGTWELTGDYDVTLTLDGISYRGVFAKLWDDDNGVWVNAFSALSNNGVSVWGSRVAVSNTPPASIFLGERLALYGRPLSFSVSPPVAGSDRVYSYSLVSGPIGLAVDRASGAVRWTPTLPQVDTTFPVVIRAVNTDGDLAQTLFMFSLTVKSPVALRRLELEFSAPASSGLQDVDGQFTGLTRRLPGTGAALPAGPDSNLRLNTVASQLELSSTSADYNGRNGLPTNTSPGVALSELGFTGSEDFSYTAVFHPITGLEFIDQAGAFIGASSDALTRTGTFVFSFPEKYAVHTLDGADRDGHFFGFDFDGSNGLTTTITRQSGTWRYFVNGSEWNPLTPTTFLNGRSDLIAGVFAITPLNGNRKTIKVDSLSLVVATQELQLSLLDQWRIMNFGQLTASGDASDESDPDGDGMSNLLEYALGANPLVSDERPSVPLSGINPTSRHLTLTFNRIADSTLIYRVEGSSDLASGFVPVWTSTGSLNLAGGITVEDTVDLGTTPKRFLRLTVER